MKIAIPTDDGLFIAKDFLISKAFLVFTIRFNKITGQEMRWNNPPDIQSGKNNFISRIEDCDTVILHSLDETISKELTAKKIKWIITDQEIITSIATENVDKIVRKESNTCCCP